MTNVMTNGVGDGHADSYELRPSCSRVAVEQTFHTTVRGGGEETGGDGAPGTTDAVHADYVERVIQPNLARMRTAR